MATPRHPGWPGTLLLFLLGILSITLAVQTMLGDRDSSPFLSSGLRIELMTFAAGEPLTPDPITGEYPGVPFLPLMIRVAGLAVLCSALLLAPTLIRRRSRQTDWITQCLFRSSGWLCFVGVHELLQLACFLAGFHLASALLGVLLRYSLSVSLAGWLCELVRGSFGDETADRIAVSEKPWFLSKTTLAAALLYVVVFSTMNWKLYDALMIPHGDSAMYEEHLWNVWHGKGFRSYLDQGLFLGEHVQVVHLLLLPLHVIWPSHVMLEVCESLALASGAIAVYWIARRHTQSPRAASLFASAYLLYPALQFLDVAIDLKTFRPTSFGVPAMLFAIDQMERGRWKTTVALFVLALSAKEDYALVLGPLGVWLAADAWLESRKAKAVDPGAESTSTSVKTELIRGGCLAAGSVGYLLLVTRVVIPWFRDGSEVHYARYFAEFGDSLGEIIINILTNPGLLFSQLVTASSVNYLLALMVPLVFLPLLSPSRFLVAVPILGLLCLNEIVKSDPFPRHHFQAPVVPILFWAAAAGTGRLRSRSGKRVGCALSLIVPTGVTAAAWLLVAGCLVGGFFQSISPLSIAFWDTNSGKSWREYRESDRSRAFPLVFEQIPADARVASTDFVHTRFTHHERSYDYSGYLRRVAEYEDRVPDDTDYIVIDTAHRYSTIKKPTDVRELKIEPENWELLQDRTDGLFIVLRRKE